MLKEPPIIEDPGQRKFPHRVVWPCLLLVLVLASVFLMRIGRPVPRNTIPQDLPEPVSLATTYNASTTDSTNVRNNPRNPDNLEEFPLGENVYAGVRFSVNGMLLLNGRHPDRIEALPLHKKCRKIHVLHGVTGKMPHGTTVAQLVVHYASGQQHAFDIRYGEHVRDWWTRPTDPPLESPLAAAWTGQNQLTRKEGASLNVYVTTFDNPRSDDLVQTMDLVSANTRCCPFFLGLTTE